VSIKTQEIGVDKELFICISFDLDKKEHRRLLKDYQVEKGEQKKSH